MDEPRAFYTEWSKSEREKQVLHINIYIYIYGSSKDGIEEHICKAAMET